MALTPPLHEPSRCHRAPMRTPANGERQKCQEGENRKGKPWENHGDSHEIGGKPTEKTMKYG